MHTQRDIKNPTYTLTTTQKKRQERTIPLDLHTWNEREKSDFFDFFFVFYTHTHSAVGTAQRVPELFPNLLMGINESSE